MTIKVNKEKEDGSPDFGNVASIAFHGFADRYYPHPDHNVDLACVDVTLLAHMRVEGKPLYIKHLNDKFLTPINYEKVAAWFRCSVCRLSKRLLRHSQQPAFG